MSSPAISPRDTSHKSAGLAVSPLSLPTQTGYFSPQENLASIIQQAVVEQAPAEQRGVDPSQSPSLEEEPEERLSVSFSEIVVSDLAGVGTLREPRHRKSGNLNKSPGQSPTRFKHHVSFDTFTGEPTVKNALSFTRTAKHKGYQYNRRSRTFMVGLDENDYSNTALEWTLEELMDDGDEIICLRVVEKDAKVISEHRQYQKEADTMLQSIQRKNKNNIGIMIVLEFALGKLHDTFQHMIQLHEPAMLIVGTRGRSLGGFQSIVSNRNSFSKWCLQYSPIPVVVVRPTEKRMKKKHKRDQDPTRHDYARILKNSGVRVHETEVWSDNMVFEPANDAVEEAHLVADAMRLPAKFDPSIKPIDPKELRKHSWVAPSEEPVFRAKRPISYSEPSGARITSTPPTVSPAVSEAESSESADDEDGEYEVVDGRALLGTKGKGVDAAEEEKRRRRLHAMEMDEAEALKEVKKRQKEREEKEKEREGREPGNGKEGSGEQNGEDGSGEEGTARKHQNSQVPENRSKENDKNGEGDAGPSIEKPPSGTDDDAGGENGMRAKYRYL